MAFHRLDCEEFGAGNPPELTLELFDLRRCLKILSRSNMNVFFRSFSEIFKSKLAYVFLLTNLCLCGFALNWKKVFDYVDKIHEPNCKPKIVFSNPTDIRFAADCYRENQTTSDEILIGFFNLISFPSIIGTDIFIEDFKKIHPDWCRETFEVLKIFVFAIFNSFYLFLLGIFIEQFYEKYHATAAAKEKYLNL